MFIAIHWARTRIHRGRYAKSEIVADSGFELIQLSEGYTWIIMIFIIVVENMQMYSPQ